MYTRELENLNLPRLYNMSIFHFKNTTVMSYFESNFLVTFQFIVMYYNLHTHVLTTRLHIKQNKKPNTLLILNKLHTPITPSFAWIINDHHIHSLQENFNVCCTKEL